MDDKITEGYPNDTEVVISICLVKLIVVQHIIKGVIKLVRNLLDLELFSIDLILNIINSVVQFGNIALTILITSFSNFESVHKVKNFVLQFLFSFCCFFSGNFKLFHVFSNGLKFLFNIFEFSFSELSPFSCSFAFIFLYSKLSGDFIKFLFIVACHFGGFSQVFVSLFKFHFVVHGLVFKVFDLLQDSIGVLGHHCKFGNSFSKSSICLLCFFFHQHNTSRKGSNILLSILEFFFLLFKCSQDFGHFVSGFIKVTLIGLDLFAKISDVAFMLIIGFVSILYTVFMFLDGSIESISLCFQRLHLLSDGVHFAILSLGFSK